ncbi:AraC family transcriptional regulator [Mesorhizobium sp. L-8-10]|uniref:helix-turn-helix domain-containing protein n=1 Tax=Mesorhizobium sp. L-8-10 TaxID=2744523 RepID=UPI0019272CA9|nr:AraC family transcriptional regulator [Mesorhizobium sp. L-8-10]BCH28894.1 AraC family transcriptional regulator [Mesorhizobium sp. L-8-10]
MSPHSERLDIRSYSGEVQSHRHDYHQVVLPLSGVMDMEIDGRGGLVAAGRGAFIATDATHAFQAPPSGRFVVADLPDDGNSALWTEAELFRRTAFFTITQPLQSLIDYLAATIDIVTPAARSHWCGLLVETLNASQAEPATAADMIVERAIRFMRAKLEQPITVADIAAAAGAGETRLHELFRQRTGDTPHGRLAELRLDAACRLLTTTSLPIAEIAVRTGHADQSALTRKLRISRGVTPAVLRRGRGASG